MQNHNRKEQHLYPAIEPAAVEKIQVSDLHTVVYEDVGARDGRPALFLHGGPGVGISPDYRRFFDPAHYRQILVDQRGAGRSKPHAERKENTTWELIEDFEKIRKKLGFDNWVVMGGSWGSLLALCYAIKYPASVAAIIIRGIFLGRQSELDWLFKPGLAANVYPDEWERFTAVADNAQDIIGAYNKMLSSDNPDTVLKAATAWSRWEGTMNTMFPVSGSANDHQAISIARIEALYTAQKFFMPSDNHVLDNAASIAHIPTHIINGRFDTICPSGSAWDLHKAMPGSALTIVPDGGHSPLHGGMTAELVRAADACRRY